MDELRSASSFAAAAKAMIIIVVTSPCACSRTSSPRSAKRSCKNLPVLAWMPRGTEGSQGSQSQEMGLGGEARGGSILSLITFPQKPGRRGETQDW